jgi:PhnB protein
MKQLNPYLNFPGTAEEALNFYKSVFGGEISEMNRFDSMPSGEGVPPLPEEYKNKVMHASFKADGIMFMVSDGMPGQPVTSGTAMSMSVGLDDPKETEDLFGKLSEGGKITMPLQDTFWGAKFGMFTDKFGINWMFNCDLKK